MTQEIIEVPRTTYAFDDDLYFYPNTSQKHMSKRLKRESKKKLATAAQRKTLEKIRNCNEPIRSNQGTARSKRKAFVQSPCGVQKRRDLIKKAIKELERTKRQEVAPRQKGRRMSKKVTSVDVQRWLCIKKKLNFSNRTIMEDLRTIRRQTT